MASKFGRLLANTVCLFLLVSWLAPKSVTSQERWSKEWEEMIEITQPSGKIMDAIGIKPGMTVGEIGAGNGRFAVWLAGRVGQSGKVYANDIEPRALEFMRKRCQEENISNMIVVEGQEDNPGLPPGTIDVVIFANTLHMVEEPVPLLKNIIPSLKSNGILVLLEADKEKLMAQQNHPMAERVPPKNNYLKWLQDAGYELVREHTFLPWHFLLIFRVKELENE